MNVPDVLHILLVATVGFAVSEALDTFGSAARSIVRRAAGWRYSDHERAVVRAEEWAALIEERPGQIMKLMTALSFLAFGLAHGAQRAVGRARLFGRSEA